MFLQYIGETAHLPVQLLVGKDFLFAGVISFPNESGFVLPPGMQMAIQTVHRQVQFTPDKPFMDAFAEIFHQNLVPFPEPFQLFGLLGPESIGVIDRLAIHRFVFIQALDSGLFPERLRRVENPIFPKYRCDGFLVGNIRNHQGQQVLVVSAFITDDVNQHSDQAQPQLHIFNVIEGDSFSRSVGYGRRIEFLTVIRNGDGQLFVEQGKTDIDGVFARIVVSIRNDVDEEFFKGEGCGIDKASAESMQAAEDSHFLAKPADFVDLIEQLHTMLVWHVPPPWIIR